MGILISRFRRKKTTGDVLEVLEAKIKAIEQRNVWTEQRQKTVLGNITIYSVAIYVVLSLIFFFFYRRKSTSWFESFYYASPLIALPPAVILAGKVISWYYNRKISKDRIKLVEMRKEKKKILEEVMNTETYKVAKDLLDKFGDPNHDSNRAQLMPFVPSTNVPGTKNTPASFLTTNHPATPGQLRQRQLMATSTPKSSNTSFQPGLDSRNISLPYPLFELNRSFFDKCAHYLTGDGPNNRFALICINCHAHNGMAVFEEFEYVSYKCAYCKHFNPARKHKPQQPPLQLSSTNKSSLCIAGTARTESLRERQLSSSSDGEKFSGSDSEDEKELTQKEMSQENLPPAEVKNEISKKED